MFCTDLFPICPHSKSWMMVDESGAIWTEFALLVSFVICLHALVHLLFHVSNLPALLHFKHLSLLYFIFFLDDSEFPGWSLFCSGYNERYLTCQHFLSSVFFFFLLWLPLFLLQTTQMTATTSSWSEPDPVSPFFYPASPNLRSPGSHGDTAGSLLRLLGRTWTTCPLHVLLGREWLCYPGDEV